MPIPKLYMRQQLDVKTAKTKHEVVDGQQRVAAVLEFYEDGFGLPADEGPFGKLSYSKLPADAKKNFLSYEFSVDLLVNAADADVLGIFARINSYSVPLNAQEKRNAKFFGSFKRAAYTLGLEHLEFWRKHKVLTDTGIARMKEAELTSELMIGMIDGLQDKKKSIDKFYDKWDDSFPYRTKATIRFRDIVDLLEDALADTLSKSRFRKPALFYSLFLAVYELRYSSIGDISGQKKAFGEAQAKRIKQALRRLDDILNQAEPPKKYSRFVTACQRQTDNIQPRRIRHETLLAEFSA